MSGRPDPTTVVSYVTHYSGYPPAVSIGYPAQSLHHLQHPGILWFWTGAASAYSL